MSDLDMQPAEGHPPLWLSALVCVVLIAATAWLRLDIFAHQSLPIGYSAVIVIAGWTTRNRGLVWMAVIACIAISAIRYFVIGPAPDPTLTFNARLLRIGMVQADLLLVAVVVDALLRRQRTLRLRTIELAAQHRKLQDLIEQQKLLHQELDLRRRTAEEDSLRKSRFLGAASHDIRTPANAIGLLAELIQRSAADSKLAEDIPELARELQKSSLNLINLVSDVLDVSRLDVGGLELRAADFDFTPWFNDECQRLQPLADAKKIAFEYRPPQNNIRLHADRIKLSRILVNLVGNAIKFTDAGQVHVTAQANADGTLRISVADTGIGIAPENHDRIFDEFHQLKSSSRDRDRGRSSGLGLSISRRLLKAMGGDITLTSTPGQGTTFTFTLPSSCIIHEIPPLKV